MPISAKNTKPGPAKRTKGRRQQPQIQKTIVKKSAVRRARTIQGVAPLAVPKKTFSVGDSGKNIINNVNTKRPVHKSQKKIVQDYLCCLVDNANCESRFPDSQPRKTSLFTSIASYDVPITFGSSNQGRFSIAVQPQMGDISSPDHYQAAIANVSTDTWDATDWSAPASYLSNINGRDPRIDINSQYLLNNGNQGAWLSTVVTNPALAQPSTIGGVQNLVGSSVGTLTAFPDLGSLKTIQNSNGTLTVPAGQYMITITINGVSSNAGTMTNILPKLIANDAAYTVENTINTYAASVATGASFNASRQMLVTIPESTPLYFTILKTSSTVYIAASDLSSLTSTVTITPIVIPSVAPPVNYGAIELIRPVAQTMLVTYLGPTLLDGGRVSSAYLPKSMLESNFFTSATANDFGNLQNVENVANLRDSYDGRLEDGTYVWWCPYDPSDWEFQSVSQMNASQWPSMVASGIFTPGSAMTAGTSSAVVRVRLLTTFEFITKSTAFEASIECGSTASMDEVNMLLANEPHAMPNKTHKSWISNMFSSVGKFIKDNSSLIGALGNLALAVV